MKEENKYAFVTKESFQKKKYNDLEKKHEMQSDIVRIESGIFETREEQRTNFQHGQHANKPEMERRCTEYFDYRQENPDRGESLNKEISVLTLDVSGEANDVFEGVLEQMQNTAKNKAKRGNFQEVEEIYQDVLEKVLLRYDRKHIRVGTAWHNLGCAQLKNGRHFGALKSMQTAVRIREDALGRHALVIESLIELGIIQLCARQFEESLDTFLKAMDLNVPINNSKASPFGEKYELIQAKLYNNIGCVYLERGVYKSSNEMFAKAEEFYNKFYSSQKNSFFDFLSDHRGISAASTLSNVAYLRMCEGDYKWSANALESSLEILYRLLEPTNNRIVQVLDNFAYCHVQLKDYESALEAYEGILEIHIMTLDRNHIDRAANMKKMVIVHLQLHQYDEAYTKALRVVDIEERHLNRKNINVMQTRKLLNTLEKCLENMTLWKTVMHQMKKIGCHMFDGSEEDNLAADFEISKPKIKSHLVGHQMRLV